MRKTIGILATVFFAVLLLYSAYNIYSTFAAYHESGNIHNEIISQVVSLQRSELKEDAKRDWQTNTDEQKKDSALKTVSQTVPITVDFDKLCAINPDVVGWIYCNNTGINYPIVLGDDNTYYLDHLLNGEYNKSGTLFIDDRCSFDFSDMNTIIYGHHMKDGSMLASIVEYHRQDYYDAHPVIYLLTPTDNYIVNIFSGYVTDPGSESFTVRFDDETEYENFLTTAIKKSNIKSNVTVTSQDKLITLSTCSYEYTDARYVVHAMITKLEDRKY